MCDPVAPASLAAEVELSAAPQGRTARLVLDLGYTDAQAAAVVRDLADGMLGQIETLLANRTTDLPAQLRGALTALADALVEQSVSEATVTALDTPLMRSWRAHPAGRGREASRMGVGRSGWTVGADHAVPRDWSGEVVQMPFGRLHAVSAAGLIAGRALCLAPVTPLDPRDWRWPDDGDEEWPLCWICLALARVQS